MNAHHTTVLAATSSIVLLMLVLQASRTNAFDEPPTFVGIAVGVALAVGVWVYGRRRQSRR